MAKGFKQGAGGPDPMNFKVVGGTSAPSNPKENTIWVNTGTQITGWVFSAAEPAAPEEGMVWFTTANYSPTEFNALKKNGIQVYPIFTKQYIGGAWVEKTANICQGGAWAEFWDGTLYDAGATFSDYTGGWKSTVGSSSTAAGTLTFNSDHMLFKSPVSSNTGTIILMPAKSFDMTHVKSVSFTISTTLQHDTRYKLHIRSVSSNTTLASKTITSTSKATYTIDTSAVTGKCYVWLAISSSESSSYGYKVYKVKLNFA